MPKKPIKLSLSRRAINLVKRNPLKSATAVLAFFAVVPGGLAGATYIRSTSEPLLIAQRYWVREQLAPLLMVQNSQATAIDRFLLYQQQEALAKAKADPAVKISPTAQDRVRDLENQVRDTENRIKKATK